MDQGDDIPQTVQGVLEKSSFDVFFSPFDACNQKGLPKTPHILARVVHISIYFMCCTVELMFLLFLGCGNVYVAFCSQTTFVTPIREANSLVCGDFAFKQCFQQLIV